MHREMLKMTLCQSVSLDILHIRSILIQPNKQGVKYMYPGVVVFLE